MTHPIADARYVSFTTFRRNGTPVATPVWIAPLGDGRLGFMTNDNVGKTKRLAHTRRIELRECDMRGRVAEGAPVVHGRAVVVREEAGQAEIRRAVERKYGLLARGFSVVQTVTRALPFLPQPAPRAAIVITLDD